MGAETVVYCRVLKLHEEWIEVQAVTLAEAGEQAQRLPDVARVLETSYEKPQ